MKHLLEDADLRDLTAYDLIEALSAAFPHRCIGKTETEIDAHRYAGKRELIDWLVAVKFAEQEPDDDDGVL